MAALVLVAAPVGADPAPAPDLLAVDAVDGRAIAVGSRGAIAVYDARADRWVEDRLPTTVAVHDVELVGRTAWAVGEGGQYWFFDGKRWDAPAGGTSSSYYGVAMADAGRGVAVGRKGRIFHRRAGRWEELVGKGTTKTLRAVARVGTGSRERFVAVGEGGVALALARAGRTLAIERESTGVDADLVALAACPGSRAEAVAAGVGAVLRDRDGGRWRALPAPPVPISGLALDCRGGRVRAVVAVGGDQLMVFDPGAKKWASSRVEGAAVLRDVARLDRKRLVVVGERGFRRVMPAPLPR